MVGNPEILDRPDAGWSAAGDTAAAALDLRRRRLIKALQVSGLFAGVSEAAFEELLAELELVNFRSGDRVMAQRDPGDCLYIVVSGRVRVVVDLPGGKQLVVAELGPGQAVGEMALLSGEPRSASVYAIRDLQLARLSQEAFNDYLTRHPMAVMQSFTRTVVKRLSPQRAVAARAGNNLATIALVPTSRSVPLGEFARHLSAALAAFEPSLHLGGARVAEALDLSGREDTFDESGNDARISGWLSEQELAYRYLVYEADPTLTPWTQRCLRQADLVLVVADGDTAESNLGEIKSALLDHASRVVSTRQMLVLLHNRGSGTRAWSGTARWMAAGSFARHFHVVADDASDYARLARSLSGRAVGLVLGGGGARGFAHVGVIRAMQEFGIPIDLIGGTSMGALIAAAYAMGWSTEEILTRTMKGLKGMIDLTVPIVSIIAAKKAAAQLHEFVGDTEIEDLHLPFYSVSSSLTNARAIIHDHGSLLKGVMASNSAPAIYPPVVLDGEFLVDGAVLNNVPVDVMQGLVEGGSIIGVDVSPPVDMAATFQYDAGLSGWRVLRNRLNPFAKEKLQVPTILNVIMRTSELASLANRRQLMSGIADVYLQPSLEMFELFQYQRGREIAAAGYQAAVERLANWRPRGLQSPGGGLGATVEGSFGNR